MINPYNICMFKTSYKDKCLKMTSGYHQDLPSKPKARMASGQGSHWLIESPIMFIYYIGLFHSKIFHDIIISRKTHYLEITHMYQGFCIPGYGGPRTRLS